MADKEIDSFVLKFKTLRAAGIEATLNVETKLGEVSISINCKVGRDLPPPLLMSPSGTVISRKPYRSPSYYRRQARRRAERKAQMVVELKPPSADQADDEVTEEVSTEEEIETDQNQTVMDEVTGTEEELMDSSEDEETKVDIELDQKQLKTELDSTEPKSCISMQLDDLIQQSKKNRDLWEKFGALPP